MHAIYKTIFVRMFVAYSGRLGQTKQHFTKNRKKEARQSQSKRDNTHKSETSGKDPNGGTKDNLPSSPYEEGPTFYENLPFHGIQAPPNKSYAFH
ncbi:hypothetical protein Avbf_02890 [Armadillidium vulgare]|nr:hypothetical protein Avbf_02890 [Armadillidium vulgare]